MSFAPPVEHDVEATDGPKTIPSQRTEPGDILRLLLHALFVPRSDFFCGRRRGDWGARTGPAGWVAEDDQPAQVEQLSSNAGDFPVEYGSERVAIEQKIGPLEIAMEQTDRRSLWSVLYE